MVSYLGSLVQFRPATGRTGRCRQISLCVDSTHRVPATLGLPCTGVSVHSPSTLQRLLAAQYAAGPALSAVPVFRYSTKTRIRLCCVLCLPQPERFRQPEAWVHSPQIRRAFSLNGPSAHSRSGLRKSLDRNWGPVCSVGGGGFSGAEFAPFPSPLPTTSSRDRPALLWSFSVPLFCEPPAVSSGRLIFSCYPTV